jgi:hypothetical protein
MKNILRSGWVIAPLAAAAVAWVISRDLAITLAFLGAFLVPMIIKVYIPYAKDNPEHLWFKRKLFGWGWTPVTWQGWIATLIYMAVVIASVLTIEVDSSAREKAFTFILPVVIATAVFIRICYKKGEKPKWQWGQAMRDKEGD